MSTALIIGLGVGAAIAAGLFVSGRRPEDLGMAAIWLLCLLWCSWTAFDLVQYGWRGGSPIPSVLGTMVVIAVAIRELVIHWHDDDALAEMTSQDSGYVTHRSYAPRATLTYSLVLGILLWAGQLAFQLYSYVQE